MKWELRAEVLETTCHGFRGAGGVPHVVALDNEAHRGRGPLPEQLDLHLFELVHPGGTFFTLP